MERQMHFLQSGLQRAEESIFPFVLILNSLIFKLSLSVLLTESFILSINPPGMYISSEVFWDLTESKKFLAFNQLTCEYPLDFCENT